MSIINYNKACSPNRPGVAFLAFIEKAKIASFTATAGEISDLTVANNATIAQINTITLTGTIGTANITVAGVTKLATFNTSLTITASDFVTANATAYLGVGLILTSSGADLIFTANVAGVAFVEGVVANVTTDLSGGSVTTQENVLQDIFHEFKTDIDTIQFTSEGTGASAFFQNNKLVAKFSKLSKDLIVAKQALVDAVACGAYAIYLDNNNQAWLVGYNEKEGNRRPLNKITANFDTGVKISDEGMGAYTITIEGGTSYDIVPFDAALNTKIIDRTATFVSWN